jgi:hypothetical protein
MAFDLAGGLSGPFELVEPVDVEQLLNLPHPFLAYAAAVAGGSSVPMMLGGDDLAMGQFDMNMYLPLQHQQQQYEHMEQEDETKS